MSSTTSQESDDFSAREAAMRLFNEGLPQSERAKQRRRTVGKIVVGATVAGAVAGMTVGTTIQQSESRAQFAEWSHANYQENDNLLKAIAAEAHKTADPLDIQGSFTISDGLGVYEGAQSIAVDLDTYKQDKDLNAFTLLQSSQDQGTYHDGDTFAVTEREVQGKEVLIVQPVEDQN